MDPGVFPNQTRRVSFDTGHRKRELFVTPTRRGGFCYMLEGYGGGCQRNGGTADRTPPLTLTSSLRWKPGEPVRVQQVGGTLLDSRVARVTIEFNDGDEQDLRCVWISAPRSTPASSPTTSLATGRRRRADLARSLHAARTERSFTRTGASATRFQAGLQGSPNLGGTVRRPDAPDQSRPCGQPHRSGQATEPRRNRHRRRERRRPLRCNASRAAAPATARGPPRRLRLLGESRRNSAPPTPAATELSGRFREKVGTRFNDLGPLDGCEIQGSYGHR